MMEIMMEILRSSWSTTRLRSIHTACSAATIGLAFNIFKWTFCGISGIYVCTDHLHLHKSIRMLGTATTATTQQQHVWPGPLMVSMDDRPKLGKTHQARYVSLLGPRASSNLVWWTCRSNITVIHHWPAITYTDGAPLWIWRHQIGSFPPTKIKTFDGEDGKDS